MKRTLYLLLLFFFALSCKEIDETPVSGALGVNNDMLTFYSAGGYEILNIKNSTGSVWTITKPEDASWCTVDRISGSAASVPVTVTVAKNAESTERSTVLTITADGSKPVTVDVIQKGLLDISDGFSHTPAEMDADKPATIYFKASKTSPLYGHSGDVYAHIGIVDGDTWNCVPADWDENIDKCRMQAADDNVWALALEPSIREWFDSGEISVSSIGIIARSADGTKKGVNNDTFFAVTDNKYTFETGTVVEEPVPAGMLHGINCHDNSVTFVFYDKDINGGHHDYAWLIGEFNGWKRGAGSIMKRDNASGCWWYTLEGIDPDKEYMFQYYLGNKDGSGKRLSDPYSEIIYSGDDKWISSSTYPGLREYPAQTNGNVSAFKINRETYSWSIADYKIEDKNDLIIYELLFRDFSATGDINGAMEKLRDGYFTELGVNAIELMPVQEFDGNDSWGYNPNSYFAMDKAYGTRRMYKEFIDECHRQGIAVLLDVVYNQATGAHPMAKLYWDASAGKTSSVNPWFNVDAPHPYNVFHDWNHESSLTREHVKRNLEYLLTEYKVDGFRFDLTKGFTNTQSTEATAARYDQSRIDILKDYNATIKAVNPDAVVILEHFCEDKEEKALAQDGMKVWRNLNNAYCQAAMGYSADSDFSGLWTGTNGMPFGSYVGFMESHDEERCAFKSGEYGAGGVKGNVEARMKRAALNAAFFLTVPGPKMIWQFGEYGYDISIEEGGRTGKKPLHWEYLDVPERKALYDTYSGLLGFRSDNPEFFDEQASFSWKVGTSAWASGRSITCSSGAKAFVVVGNFDTKSNDITVSMPSGGNWRNYFNSSETYTVTGGSITFTDMKAAEYKLLVNF